MTFSRKSKATDKAGRLTYLARPVSRSMVRTVMDIKSALDSIKYHTRVMSRLDPFIYLKSAFFTAFHHHPVGHGAVISFFLAGHEILLKRYIGKTDFFEHPAYFFRTVKANTIGIIPQMALL